MSDQAQHAKVAKIKGPVPHIRWMIRRDLPEVLNIEGDYFGDWTEEDFLAVLRARNCIGMVADENQSYDCPVIGFMIYELCKTKLHILKLAVDMKHRRRGVGRMMIEKLKGKLSTHRRSRMDIIVCEYDLGVHLFLKANGFVAEEILRGHFDDLDGYQMVYRLPREQT